MGITSSQGHWGQPSLEKHPLDQRDKNKGILQDREERKQLHSPASGAAVWIFGKDPYTEHPGEGLHDPRSGYSIILPRGWNSGEKEIPDTTGLFTKNRGVGTLQLRDVPSGILPASA